ncbi:aminopeptidase P family N-terminal domain-containing protein, partial [Stomatobaculum longum]
MCSATKGNRQVTGLSVSERQPRNAAERVFGMKEQRVERILKALEEQGLSQMLIVDPLSIYYLTEYANDPYERFFGLLLRKDGQ